MQRLIAIYMRVSSRQQDTRSQEPDLQRWVEAYADAPMKWYTDKFTGKTMERPGWRRPARGGLPAPTGDRRSGPGHRPASTIFAGKPHQDRPSQADRRQKVQSIDRGLPQKP
jgi:hypothetical protein